MSNDGQNTGRRKQLNDPLVACLLSVSSKQTLLLNSLFSCEFVNEKTGGDLEQIPSCLFIGHHKMVVLSCQTLKLLKLWRNHEPYTHSSLLPCHSYTSLKILRMNEIQPSIFKFSPQDSNTKSKLSYFPLVISSNPKVSYLMYTYYTHTFMFSMQVFFLNSRFP